MYGVILLYVHSAKRAPGAVTPPPPLLFVVSPGAAAITRAVSALFLESRALVRPLIYMNGPIFIGVSKWRPQRSFTRVTVALVKSRVRAAFTSDLRWSARIIYIRRSDESMCSSERESK